MTPGRPASAAARWPIESHVARDPDRYTLIMAAHPRCPCTRASMDGLAHVVSEAGARLAAYVLMARPADGDESWDATDVWESAKRIPGVVVVSDRDGLETQAFGARTSGQTLLYDPSGRLVFSGGLTPARGHAGASLGQASILALVRGERGARPVTDVFGCALVHAHGPES